MDAKRQELTKDALRAVQLVCAELLVEPSAEQELRDTIARNRACITQLEHDAEVLQERLELTGSARLKAEAEAAKWEYQARTYARRVADLELAVHRGLEALGTVAEVGS